MESGSLDLNLLTALDALLDECSVTRAAHRLNTSAPAMSRSLGRLRRALDDPLLVRAGRDLVPTPRAIALRTEVRDVVARAGAVFTRVDASDPAIMRRTFSLLAPEWLFTSVGFELLQQIRTDAPGVVIRFLGESHEQTNALRDGTVDIEIGQVRPTDPEIVIEHLGDEPMAGVARSGHELLAAPVTAESFAAASHISMSRRGKLHGPVDERLAELGLTRRVVCSAPNPAAMLFLVAHSDLVGVVPQRIGSDAVRALGLETFTAPVELPPLRISMAWHPRHAADLAHSWLRQCVRDTVRHCLSPQVQ